MFKIFPFIIASMFIVCNFGFAQNSNNKVMEYRNSKDTFTIVSIINDNSRKEAKDAVLTKAAKIAQKYGYKSFDVIQENEVEVIAGKEGWPSAYDFPQNLYQEEIVEKGYNRERFISGSKTDNTLRKGLRIQIKCYNTANGSYKVCDLIPC